MGIALPSLRYAQIPYAPPSLIFQSNTHHPYLLEKLHSPSLRFV